MNGSMHTTHNSDGATLVELARQRDEDAVVALIRRCSRRIVAGIRIAGVGRHEAGFDDAQNQALFEIWRRFPTLDHDDAVCGWMHRIARRTTASRIIDPAVRHRRRRERAEELTRPGIEPGPGDAVARRALLDAVLGGLSADHREVLVLRYLEGLSEAETAERLGIGVKTVSSRTTRAKRAAMDLVHEIEGTER